MGRKYKNPPIIEAVCEFRLTPDTDWDLTIPGLLYEKLQDEFPKKQARAVQSLKISTDPEGMQQEIRQEQRIALLTEDGKRFVQLGPHLLSINCLSPYPSWDGFNPFIERAFSTLTETLDIKGLERIGLRYVNLIEIPHQPVRIEDYFQFYPFLGADLPQEIGGFSIRCVFPFVDGRDSCRVQLRQTAPRDSNSTAFILDLDYSLSKPRGIRANESLKWIGEAHQKVEEIFEGAINDRLRSIFQEEK